MTPIFIMSDFHPHFLKNTTSLPEGSIPGILDLTNKKIIEILLEEVS